MSENNHEEKTPVVDEKEGAIKVEKECPVYKEPCHCNHCAWWMELVHATPGPHGGFKKETFGMCSVPALCEIMSVRPPVPPQPRPQIQLPRNMGRG